MPEPDRIHGRRAFFVDGLRWLTQPLSRVIERTRLAAPDTRRIRPPGAVDESSFAQACQRCGECVRVCPAHAIVPLGEGPAELLGTPIVLPGSAPCVVCDGLQCTHVCPSGALRPLGAPEQIRMGRAVVDDETCVRGHGDDCTLCVDFCPMGSDAIELRDAGPPTVHIDGCVGCGVCEHRCPTQPKSIVVEPA